MMPGLSASRAETYKFDASKLPSLRTKDDLPRLTLSWVGKLQSHIEACWLRPKGVTDKTNVAVRIIVEFNPDGSLKSAPSLVQVTKHPMTKAFAETAITAIVRCQPYAFLPAEEYKGGWDKLDMTFSANPAGAAELKTENEKLVKAIRERLHRPDANDDTH
jgi:hypothetical protein